MNKTIIWFKGIDGFNRPIFIDKFKNYYGSTDILFDLYATEKEVLKLVTSQDITFFGRKFGCEPEGITINNVEIISKPM